MGFIRHALLAGALALTAAAAPTAVSAQTAFPAKPITLVVPAAAGGPTDTVARLIAESMGRTLGQTVLVENVGGAGGTIAMARVAKAAPDGYTIAVWHIAQATAPALYENLKYDVVNDFDHIGRITDVPMTLVSKTGSCGQERQRAAGLDPGREGQGDLRPCRRRLGLAFVRADSHEGAWREDGRVSAIAAPARP